MKLVGAKTTGGRWRISSMELWDGEFIDLVEPGCVLLQPSGRGEFMFGCVFGDFAWPPGRGDFVARWTGNDEMDEARGTIEVEFEGTGLIGTISVFDGDESGFTADRLEF